MRAARLYIGALANREPPRPGAYLLGAGTAVRLFGSSRPSITGLGVCVLVTAMDIGAYRAGPGVPCFRDDSSSRPKIENIGAHAMFGSCWPIVEAIAYAFGAGMRPVLLSANFVLRTTKTNK